MSIIPVDSTAHVPGSGTAENPFRLRLNSSDVKNGVSASQVGDGTRGTKAGIGKHFYLVDGPQRHVVRFSWRIPSAVYPVLEADFLIHPAFSHFRLNKAVLKSYWVNELLAAAPLWTNDEEAQTFFGQCQLANRQWDNTVSEGDPVTVLLRENDVDLNIDALLTRPESMRLVVYGQTADRMVAVILRKIKCGKDQQQHAQYKQRFRLNLMAIESLSDLSLQRLPKFLTTDMKVSHTYPLQSIAEPSRQCLALTLDQGLWKVPPTFHSDIVEGVLLVSIVFSLAVVHEIKFWHEGGHYIFDCRSVASPDVVANVLASLRQQWPAARFDIQEETVPLQSQVHRAYLSGELTGTVCRGCTIERDTHNDLVEQISGALRERTSVLAKVFRVSTTTRCSGTTTAILSALFSCQHSFEFTFYYNISNENSRTFKYDAPTNDWVVFHVVDAEAWNVIVQQSVNVLKRQRTIIILDFFAEDLPIFHRAERLIVPTAILSPREVHALCSVFTAHCPGREGTFEELRRWMLRSEADPFDKHMIQFPLTFARERFAPLEKIAVEVSTAITNDGNLNINLQFLVFEAFCFVPQSLVYRSNVVPSRAILSSRIAVPCGPAFRVLHPYIAFRVVEKSATHAQVIAAVKDLLERANTTSRAWETARSLLIDRPKRVAFSHLVGWLYEAVGVTGAVAFVKSVISNSLNWTEGQPGHYHLLVARLYLRDVTETWCDVALDGLITFLRKRVDSGVEECSKITDELMYIRERTKGFLFTYAAMATYKCGEKDHSAAYQIMAEESFNLAQGGNNRSEVDRSTKAAVTCRARITAVSGNRPIRPHLPQLYMDHFPQQSPRLDDEDDE